MTNQSLPDYRHHKIIASRSIVNEPIIFLLNNSTYHNMMSLTRISPL